MVIDEINCFQYKEKSIILSTQTFHISAAKLIKHCYFDHKNKTDNNKQIKLGIQSFKHSIIKCSLIILITLSK